MLLSTDLVLEIGSNLRCLSLIHAVPRGGLDPLSLDNLKLIKFGCPHLENLELDLPMFPFTNFDGTPARDGFEAEQTLELLIIFLQFKSLRTISEVTLGTYPKIYDNSTDLDYYDAERIIKALYANKRGVPLKKFVLHLRRAERSPNWRKLAGTTSPAEKGYSWLPQRRFQSSIAAAVAVETWVDLGVDRVGELPEGAPPAPVDSDDG